MEPLKFCEKCKKPVLKPVQKDNKFYHEKCIQGETKSKSIEKDKEQNMAKFTHERKMTLNLKQKYQNQYLQKTLMTEVVRPYLQFKYKIKKNTYLELIPQFSIYFSDIEEDEAKEFIKNGGLKKLKDELQELIGDDFTVVINDIIFGSLLTKICVFSKKIKSLGVKAVSKLKNLILRKNKETEVIKKAIDCIESHSFECIKKLKPNSVKFVNQNTLTKVEDNEQKIKEYLEEKINENYDAKSNWSLSSKSTSINLDEDIEEDKFEDYFDEIKTIAIKHEKELEFEMENIKKNENFNIQLNNILENYYKESIFEYRITGLVVMNNDSFKKKYQEEKSKCPNCETKILFHSTHINYSSKILTTNFIVGKDNWYGMGVYFADQFDYAKYYYRKNLNDNSEINPNLFTMPKLNESFSIVVSEVYYDKNQRKQIYNLNLHKTIDYFPTEEQLKTKFKKFIVPKNSIHYIEVDATNCIAINENQEIETENGFEKFDKKHFIGREYCVTCKDQIYPLYGLNFQRVEYCIIWRDTNVNSPFWKDNIRVNTQILQELTGYNLYIEGDTPSALKLVWRKRFNKIILITNIGKNLEGKKFVDKVREILQFNVMVLFFASDPNHLNWIKDYPNSLFCVDDETLQKYVYDYNENGIEKIRNNVKEFFGVELPKPQNAFEYPLFEKYRKGTHKFEEIDCSEYKENE